MRSFYVRVLAAGVGAIGAPISLFFGLDLESVHAAVARLKPGDERTFGQQDEALNLICLACIVVGGLTAALTIGLAIAGHLASSKPLDVASDLVAGVMGLLMILLMITRTRSIVGNRRFDTERELRQTAFPGAEPRVWELVPLVIGYVVTVWLFSRTR